MTIADFKTYQQEAMKTRIYLAENNLVYSALGLAGEAGELVNKVKKLLRGDRDREALVAGIRGEMGDVLWYLAALAEDLDVDLADIARENIDKIRSRQSRDEIRGTGDNR